MRRIASLDGLRGIAILCVMIFHASSRSILPGGFIGVDLFFVLSGYLITWLLIREFEATDSISFRAFYWRRTLRLVPALVVLLIVCGALAVIFAGPGKLEHHFKEIALAATYTMNWARAFNFETAFYLDHTWSLAAEEQFYLAWPLLILFAMRRGGKRGVAATAIAIIVAVCAWRLYLAGNGPMSNRVYYGFDTRADCIMAGCLVAAIPRIAAIERYWPVPLSILAFIAATAPPHASWMPVVGFPVVWLCACWLLTAALGDNIFSKALSARPLVYTGKISYGLYLWHWPITMVVLRFLSPEFAIPAVIAICFGVATVSYVVVERYFLALKPKFTPQRDEPQQSQTLLTNPHIAPIGKVAL
jgi:peptidoglycan/LPS O-acetylase OafA/YrhL